MAVSSTFKQQCPSCEAMITIKEDKIGKKVECTKCKDKFIAQRPDDDEDEVEQPVKKNAKTATKKPTTAAAGKRPKVEEVEEGLELEEGEEVEAGLEVDEDEEDEKPRKSKNGKPPAKSKVRDEKDDEETPAPKKDKAKAGSNKLVLGLGLAVVGVAVLAVAAFFVMSGGSNQKIPPNAFKGGQPPSITEPEKTTPSPVIDPNPKPKPVAITPLNDAEVAKLTNLLPNDTEHVLHVFLKDAFAEGTPLREAAFEPTGGLDTVAALPMLGFSLKSVDDLIVTEKYTTPGWKFTVVHFNDAIAEDKLKTALPLEAIKVAGQPCYRTVKGKANPYFEQLAHFSIGVPNNLLAHAARRDKESYFHVLNPQTLIIADEAPLTALIRSSGKQPSPKELPTGRDGTYQTIKSSLKSILDRMEARGADSKAKVLFSSATDMEANLVPSNTPDTVIRRPRQFWDVSVLLYERKPRIRALGTSLMQKSTLKYQLRNELTCLQEVDAKEFQEEMIETSSYKVAKLFTGFGHRVKLPAPKKKDDGDQKSDDKKPTDATDSQILVHQQSNIVEFELDLVLDGTTHAAAQEIARLYAIRLQMAMRGAANPSLRHALAAGAKLLGRDGLPQNGIAPGRLPPGAFARDKKGLTLTDREPRNRISWMAGLLPYMGHDALFKRIQFNQSWRDSENLAAGNTIVPQFLDPMYPNDTRLVPVGDLPLDFGATHYVGIAGVGMDAAYYKRGDPATKHKQGVLSYDSSASLKDVEAGRGLANTILMLQIPHDGITGVGPWIAGGGATLRGVPEDDPIGPFVLTTDRNGNVITHEKKRGTYALMTDGSVRFIDRNISPEIFKAMCTIDGPAPKDFNPAKDAPLIPIPGAKE